jgi:hypothetical protein
MSQPIEHLTIRRARRFVANFDTWAAGALALDRRGRRVPVTSPNPCASVRLVHSTKLPTTRSAWMATGRLPAVLL